MGKFTNISKLTKEEQNELFIRFAKVLGSLHSAVEAANLIRDLLSEPESLMLARRLQIAELLDKGYTYANIKKVMKVSQTTIAKVQTWLRLYGDGYRTVLKRTKDSSGAREPWANSWNDVKKKYPMYFWPELLLKEIVRSANKREREKLKRVVQTLKDKTKLSKDLQRILEGDRKSNTR
jgi:uncharacterized protein YerC